MNNPQHTVHDKVEAAILLNPHLRRRNMNVSADGNCVRLTGKVNSFFEKQMAQEVLRSVEGVDGIQNDLEVDWIEN